MDYLDLSFDPLFAVRPRVKWWPWVGAQYSRSSVKTIIVGESVYRWAKRDAFEKRCARSSGLRETHANLALKFQRPSRYVLNVEGAI
jgi:hypothetical protein